MATKESTIKTAQGLRRRSADKTKVYSMYRVGGAWMLTTGTQEQTQSHYKVKILEWQEVPHEQPKPKINAVYIHKAGSIGLRVLRYDDLLFLIRLCQEYIDCELDTTSTLTTEDAQRVNNVLTEVLND